MKENKNLLIGFACGVILTGILMFFFMEERIAQTTEQLQNNYNTQQANLIDSVRQSGLVNLMAVLLKKAEDELVTNESGSISNETIAQLAALSDGFKPYAIIHPTETTPEKLSPERGHLLLMLNGLKMDSITRQNILTRVTFANAYLKNASLPGAQLSGINLSNANLEGATLDGANLTSANFHNAQLIGAKMTNIDLRYSDFTSADLSWAEMKNADLREATLNGALLSSTNLREANMQKMVAQRALMHNAFFNHANLSYADLLEAELDKAHFEKTNMQSAFLVLTTFREANLIEANIDSAIVKNDLWFSHLSDWHVPDLKALQQRYQVEKEANNNRTRFVLYPINR